MRGAALLLAAAVLAACASESHDGLPYYVGDDGTPTWLEPGSAALGSADRVGDFTLVDQTGRRVTGADVAGRIRVASFFFTRCTDLCPRLKSGLARVQAAFAGADDVVILSHSVTPEADGPDVLAAYARANGIVAGRWELLTGDRAEIERLAYADYRVNLSDGSRYGVDSLAHTETLVLVDGAGRIRGYYNGSLPYDVDRLIEDVRTLRAAGPAAATRS